MAYIEFKNINKFYGDNHVLKGSPAQIRVGTVRWTAAETVYCQSTGSISGGTFDG